MKKITALFLLLAACCLSAWAQDNVFKPFGIKSGYMKTITYNGNNQMAVNQLWFDDYGRMEKSVTTVNMGPDMGTFNTTVIMVDDKTWMIDDKGESKELGGRPEVIFNKLTDKDKKDMKFKDLGTEEYKGKLCNKYYYEQKQLVKSKITALVWEGIIVKQTIKQTFGTSVIELEELQENVNIPASTFAVPKSK